MFQNIRRRDIVLLVGLFSLAGVIIITIGLLILRDAGQQTLEPVAVDEALLNYQIAHTETTGLHQFQLAQQVALQWANDAALIFASASWSQVTAIEQVGQPGEWVYHFYSPQKARKLFVTVQPDNTVQTIQHAIQVTLPPVTVPTENWVIDSPDALATWLSNGGDQMVFNNPNLELIAQLRNVRGSGRPIWMVVGLDRQSGTTHSILIEAKGGKLIR